MIDISGVKIIDYRKRENGNYDFYTLPRMLLEETERNLINLYYEDVIGNIHYSEEDCKEIVEANDLLKKASEITLTASNKVDTIIKKNLNKVETFQIESEFNKTQENYKANVKGNRELIRKARINQSLYCLGAIFHSYYSIANNLRAIAVSPETEFDDKTISALSEISDSLIPVRSILEKIADLINLIITNTHIRFNPEKYEGIILKNENELIKELQKEIERDLK